MDAAPTAPRAYDRRADARPASIGARTALRLPIRPSVQPPIRSSRSSQVAHVRHCHASFGNVRELHVVLILKEMLPGHDREEQVQRSEEEQAVQPRFRRCRCTPCTDTEVGAQRPHPLPRCVSECYTLSAPYTEVPSTCPHRYLGAGVLSRRSHRRCARIRCAPPVARETQHTALMAPKKPTSTQNTTLHRPWGHGRDQAVPAGPLTVSRAVKLLAVKFPLQPGVDRWLSIGLK